MTPRVAYRRLFDRFGPQGWWPIDGRYRPKRYAPPPSGEAFEICVGAVLTQNTAWSNVKRALSALSAAEALTPHSLGALRQRRLERLIRPSGYFVQKAKKLKILAAWASDSLTRLRKDPLPPLRERLLQLWGIGPETADSILLYAGGRRIFVVDAYTRRIGSRIGWFPAKASYDDIQAQLSRALPGSPRVYNEMHALLVKLGKEHCRPKPVCSGCPLRPGCAAGRTS